MKINSLKNQYKKTVLYKTYTRNKTERREKEMANNNSNQLIVPGVQQALDQMKVEIAQEFGVNLAPDTTSRANGSVGGEITKRLVQMAEQQLGGRM
jgi:hypothetical protein